MTHNDVVINNQLRLLERSKDEVNLNQRAYIVDEIFQRIIKNIDRGIVLQQLEAHLHLSQLRSQQICDAIISLDGVWQMYLLRILIHNPYQIQSIREYERLYNMPHDDNSFDGMYKN